MGHLGDFGNARAAHEETFGYFGSVLRVHPDLSDLAFFDLFGQIGEAEQDPSKATAALRALGATLVHPDDAEEFWLLARENRQSLADLTEFATKLLEALVQRPIERPSGSSDGPRPTGATSEGDSSSRALRLLEGRPDLQVAVLRAQEAAASA